MKDLNQYSIGDTTNYTPIFYKHKDFLVKAFAKHINLLMKNHQNIHVLKICAYSCTLMAKTGRQSFLCAFFSSKAFVIIF